MRRVILFSGIAVLSLVGGMSLFTSCEGPAGPQGEAGDAVCQQCHSTEARSEVVAAYTKSGHSDETVMFNGKLLSEYAGGRQSCAKCHSHQGFKETVLTGRDTTATEIPIPVGIDCNTCHESHEVFEFTEDSKDFALAYTAPVDLIMYDHTLDPIDLGDAGNLCSYCHQPRNQGFERLADPTATFNITSSHWGTHYGTQSVVLAGVAGYEFNGSEPWENTAHATATSCTDCHMASSENAETGGHTFVTDVAACQKCHEGATDFNINGVQDEIEDLEEELLALLQSNKLLDETAHAIPHASENGTGAPWNVTQTAAVMNYFLAHYDHSHGVHNYKYTKALLQNTIDILSL